MSLGSGPSGLASDDSRNRLFAQNFMKLRPHEKP